MQVCLVDSSTCLSPQDRGLIYGDGFFTTARIAKHSVCYWPDHRKRLIVSARRLSFSDFSIDAIESKLNQLPESGVVRICVTRGVGPRGYAIPEQQDSHVFIELFNAPPLSEEFPRRLKVTVCQTPISMNPQLAGIKHVARLDHVLARTEVESKGFDEGLLTTGGKLICATQANLFVCRDNRVITPTIDRAGVEGVLKKQISRWCNELGIQLVEQPLNVNDLENCDEVFLSNSVFGIMSVSQLDSRVLNETGIAQTLYQKFVQSIF